MKGDWKYWLKDMGTGAIVGAGVGLAHYFLVPPKFGAVIGVLLGMVVGMGAQMILCLFLGFFSGAIEAMIPGMFVGMAAMILPLFPSGRPANRASSERPHRVADIFIVRRLE